MVFTCSHLRFHLQTEGVAQEPLEAPHTGNMGACAACWTPLTLLYLGIWSDIQKDTRSEILTILNYFKHIRSDSILGQRPGTLQWIFYSEAHPIASWLAIVVLWGVRNTSHAVTLVHDQSMYTWLLKWLLNPMFFEEKHLSYNDPLYNHIHI